MCDQAGRMPELPGGGGDGILVRNDEREKRIERRINKEKNELLINGREQRKRKREMTRWRWIGGGWPEQGNQ